jgi:hypothetical protein
MAKKQELKLKKNRICGGFARFCHRGTEAQKKYIKKNSLSWV